MKPLFQFLKLRLARENKKAEGKRVRSLNHRTMFVSGNATTLEWDLAAVPVCAVVEDMCH